MAKKRSIFVHNFGLKVVSLVLAILLEVYFYSPDNSVSKVMSATVEIRGLPRETMVTEPAGAERGIPAQIRVRGPRTLVDQVVSQPQRLAIFYPESHPSSFTAIVDAFQLSLPAGVEVLDVHPTAVTLRTERIHRKELLIVYETVGSLAPGMQIESINLFPDTVVARGPKSQIEILRAIESQALNVSDLSESTKVELPLKLPGGLVSLGVTVVTADIKISPITKERTFKSLRLKALAPEGFAASVVPARVSVTVSGPVKLVDELSREGLDVLADGRKLGAGVHEVKVVAKLPKGVTIKSSSPLAAKLTLVSGANDSDEEDPESSGTSKDASEAKGEDTKKDQAKAQEG